MKNEIRVKVPKIIGSTSPRKLASIICVAVLMILAFIAGGTAVPLPSCYIESGCGFEVKQKSGDNINATCGRVLYAFSIYEQCDGFYVSNGSIFKDDSFISREKSYLINKAGRELLLADVDNDDTPSYRISDGDIVEHDLKTGKTRRIPSDGDKIELPYINDEGRIRSRGCIMDEMPVN